MRHPQIVLLSLLLNLCWARAWADEAERPIVGVELGLLNGCFDGCGEEYPDVGTAFVGVLGARGWLAPRIEIEGQLGAVIFDGRALAPGPSAVSRWSNPSLGINYHLRGAGLTVGGSATVPLASVRNVDGLRWEADAQAFQAAALAHGYWNLWKWTPEWMTVAGAGRLERGSRRFTWSLDLGLALAFPTGGERRDPDPAVVWQVAGGGAWHLRGIDLDARLSQVGVDAGDAQSYSRSLAFGSGLPVGRARFSAGLLLPLAPAAAPLIVRLGAEARF